MRERVREREEVRRRERERGGCEEGRRNEKQWGRSSGGEGRQREGVVIGRLWITRQWSETLRKLVCTP